MPKAKIAVAWADPTLSPPPPKPNPVPGLLKQLQVELLAQRDALEAKGGAADAFAVRYDRVLVDLFGAGVICARGAQLLELDRCS